MMESWLSVKLLKKPKKPNFYSINFYKSRVYLIIYWSNYVTCKSDEITKEIINLARKSGILQTEYNNLLHVVQGAKNKASSGELLLLSLIYLFFKH